MYKVTAERYRSEGEPFDIELTRDGATVTASVWTMPEDQRSKGGVSGGGFRISSAASPGIGSDALYIRGCSTLCDSDVATYTFQCGASNAKEWFNAIVLLIGKLNEGYAPPKPKKTTWRSEGKPYDVEITLVGATLTARTYSTPQEMGNEPAQTVLAGRRGDYSISISCGNTDIYEHTLFLRSKDVHDKDSVAHCRVGDEAKALKSFNTFKTLIDELNADYVPPKRKATTTELYKLVYDLQHEEYRHGLQVGIGAQNGWEGEAYNACKKAYEKLAEELGLTQGYYS